MVLTIKNRGHVVSLFDLPHGHFHIKQKRCPSCKKAYDNDAFRKCVYLCCLFEKCLHCVINKDMLECTVDENAIFEWCAMQWSPRVPLNNANVPASGLKNVRHDEDGVSPLSTGKMFAKK